MKFDRLAPIQYICFIIIAHPMHPQLPQMDETNGCPILSRFYAKGWGIARGSVRPLSYKPPNLCRPERTKRVEGPATLPAPVLRPEPLPTNRLQIRAPAQYPC